MKHPLCALALLSLLAACAPLPTQPDDAATTASAIPPTPHLRVLGSVGLDYATPFGDTLVGGLSGMDYDPATQRYLLISDDRATHDPVRAYTATLRYSSSGLQPPEFTAVTFLLHPGQQRFTPTHRPQAGVEVPDPEAARWLPGTEAFLWTSEGDFARGFGPQLRTHHWGDGAQLRHYQLPDAFTPRPAQGTGPRANGTLEGLALSPDGRTAWLAMELPWHQDGPQATPDSGGAPVRITAMDIASGQPLRQIAYQGDAVPQRRRLPGPQINGVSEILAHGPHHLLVLERSYSAGAGFGARLYRIDTRAGSDTLTLDALTPANHRPVPKTLVADLAALGLTPDNIEGMTWGPPVQGRCVLVFVSDDNFNPAQVTQFIAAQYLGPDGDGGQCGTTGASVLSTYP